VPTAFYRMLIYGVALVLLAIYRPEGLIPQSATAIAASLNSMLRRPGVDRRASVSGFAALKPGDGAGEMRMSPGWDSAGN